MSVSAYLGRLVEAELGRRDTHAVGQVSGKATETSQAIAALVDVRLAIDELDGIAGRLARSATAHGASWADVASSLQLTPDAAKRAYSRPQS